MSSMDSSCLSYTNLSYTRGAAILLWFFVFVPSNRTQILFGECKLHMQELETTDSMSMSSIDGTKTKLSISKQNDLLNWCTMKLCSKSACEEEKLKRMHKERIMHTNSSRIHFSRKTMREEAFEKLFYSSVSPYPLQTQQLIVVTTSYGVPPRYPLEWIDSQPWPVFISTKEGGFGFASEPWGNVGQEIASYVRFILMFWDHLPENVAFVHGHEKTWHQEGYRMSYMLRHLCLGKFQYASLNAYESDAWRPRKGSRSYFNIIKRYWKLVEPYLGDIPKTGFKEKCCAQFVVSRERIKRRPRALYEMILKQMTDRRKNYNRAPHGKNIGWDLIHFWESIWHYIFGEEAIVNTKRKYGFGIDLNIENGRPLSKRQDRTLKLLIACQKDEVKS